MVRGDIILNAQNGRYAVLLGITKGGLASVRQIQIRATGELEMGSRTTWRMGVFDEAQLNWLDAGSEACARYQARECVEEMA